ncbi:restriction endonuclease subunit S [Mycoplasma anserisalpingitidis]|uniref:restriction endonuclease subunit S n=1 Tax=Mycoplasma anserisalpingitidis TaxID=519450 RepID=UPI0019118E2E|nr:restriction endonuclease subunit S [Mycoplasma anserisalpingitidis]
MSKIWDLIKNEKVEWKTIGEVFEIRNGYTPYKNNPDYWKDGVYNWFRLDDLKEQGSILKKSKLKITWEAVKGSGLFKKNSFLLSTTATIGQFGLLYEDSLANQQFTNLSVKKEYENTISVKFLLHYFYEISEWCINNSNLSTFKKVNINELKELKIPIPSIDTQNKIVKILDKFNIYVKELERELERRNKQYQHYLNTLLSFDESVKKFKLNQISEIYDGTHQTPKYTKVGVPFISAQNITNINQTDKYISIDEFKKYKIKPIKDDLFFTRIGSIGKVAIVQNDNPLAYYVTLALIRANKKLICTKFLKYSLLSSYGKKEINKRKLVKAIPPKINLVDLGQIEISLPDLITQQKIIQILDKFDDISNNILIGLPKEIKLRKQQYEYYRNKLLDFPKN